MGCGRAQAPPRGWAASLTHPRRQPETRPRRGSGGAAWGLQGPWPPRCPSPVMWGLGHGPAIVGGVADHAPQQRRLMHQLLGDAANVYAGTAEAPPGAWGAGGAWVSRRPADPNSAGQRAGLSPLGLMPAPQPLGHAAPPGLAYLGGKAPRSPARPPSSPAGRLRKRSRQVSTLGTWGPRSLRPQPRCPWTGTRTLPDRPPGQRGPAQPTTLLQGQLRPGTPQTGPRPPGPPRSPLPQTPRGVPVHLLRAPSWALLPLLRKVKLGGQMAGQPALEPGSRSGPHSAPLTGAHPAPRPTPNPHPCLQGPPSCEPHILSPGTTAGFPPGQPQAPDLQPASFVATTIRSKCTSLHQQNHFIQR